MSNVPGFSSRSSLQVLRYRPFNFTNHLWPACRPVGLVTGRLEASYRWIALQTLPGWSNIGYHLMLHLLLSHCHYVVLGDFTKTGIGVAQAVPLSLLPQRSFLTMIVRTQFRLGLPADAAKKGDFGAVGVLISCATFPRDFGQSRFTSSSPYGTN